MLDTLAPSESKLMGTDNVFPCVPLNFSGMLRVGLSGGGVGVGVGVGVGSFVGVDVKVGVEVKVGVSVEVWVAEGTSVGLEVLVEVAV